MNAGILEEIEQSKFSFGFCTIPAEQKTPVFIRPKKRKVILLAGPTGTGKTELSLLLATSIGNCEIISADSMQVYRGMDIGTAKIPADARQGIPHHLIDIRTITESFNVVDFYYEARAAIESILARGKTPIVVGGAGFYFRSLIYGPPDGPPSVGNVRTKLEKEMETLGVTALFHRLQSLDPAYAASITKGDKHKIVRALEIISLTGQPVSKFSWRRRYPCFDYDYHCWFIYRPKESLYKILEERCDRMVQSGLLDEVKGLLEAGLLKNSSASQAIGYRQIVDYLASPQTEKDLAAAMQLFKVASRHYAKKQFTWFRKESCFRWLNVDLHDLETAMEMIQHDYMRGDLM